MPNTSVPSQPIRALLVVGEEAFAKAAFCTGDFSQPRRLLEQALEQANAEHDLWSAAAATESLGLLFHYENITKRMTGLEVDGADIEAEEMLFQRALVMRRRMSDERGTSLPLFGLGLVAQVLRNDWVTAIVYFRAALQLVEAFGDAIDLYTQSEVYRHVGFYFAVAVMHPDEAVRYLQRSLDLRLRLGDPRRIPSGLEALGEAELAAGNTSRGLELLEQAVEQSRAAGLLPRRIEMCEEILREAKATQHA
jgi:tetratricopeptide (TPR) repeat protein